MSICYWGGNCGAKKHLQYLMSFNGKKFCILHNNYINIEESIVHWHGYLNKEDSKKIINRYWDKESHQTTLYRDGDELLSFSSHRRIWKPVNTPNQLRFDIDYDHEEGFKLVNVNYPSHSLIKDSIHRGAIFKRRKSTTNMSKEYVERYKNDPKLKNTMVYYEAVKNSKQTKIITVDDVPDCHLLIPYNPHIGRGDRTTAFYSQDWNRFRNIAPYKSNLVDAARNMLDVYNRKSSWKEKWDNSVFDTDRKKLWRYLDDEVFTKFEAVPRELKKHGIEFEYFDMDKDSFKKTFEIDKDPLFRLMTYTTMDALKNFPTKEVRDRYHRLTDIAKEYVAQCGREDNRITL
jgi:hypothetical protein